MTDSYVSSSIFDYPDVLHHLTVYLSVTDLKSLSLTQSSVTDPCQQRIYQRVSIDQRNAEKLCKSRLAISVVSLTVLFSHEENDTLSISDQDYWCNLHNLQNLTIRNETIDAKYLIISFESFQTLLSFHGFSIRIVFSGGLPSTLKDMAIDGCQVKNLPSLSGGWQSQAWEESYSSKSLPILPDSLTSLVISNSRLTSLPDPLPPSLSHLDCRDNYLEVLPKSLPPRLLHLNCSGNQLSSIPRLPQSLSELICKDNNLTSLPNNESTELPSHQTALPTGLKTLLE
ncbi:hypothetical protein BKA69DRAFT_1128492 [Paraphysoderma sedebokerense]|nr:hypothetical protein BKA69DRAFT_1128492 [Paraphysoderma sedebokerense]